MIVFKPIGTTVERIKGTAQRATCLVRDTTNVILNGKQTRMPQGVRMQLGLKHLVTQVFYGKLIPEFQKATSKGDIEKGAEILKRIPKRLLDSFHDLNAIQSSKRWG